MKPRKSGVREVVKGYVVIPDGAGSFAFESWDAAEIKYNKLEKAGRRPIIKMCVISLPTKHKAKTSKGV